MVVNRLAVAGVWTPVSTASHALGKFLKIRHVLGKRHVILLARRRNFDYSPPPSRVLAFALGGLPASKSGARGCSFARLTGRLGTPVNGTARRQLSLRPGHDLRHVRGLFRAAVGVS